MRFYRRTRPAAVGEYTCPMLSQQFYNLQLLSLRGLDQKPTLTWAFKFSLSRLMISISS